MGLLDNLLAGGQQDLQGSGGGLFSSPLAKAAMAGVASMALKNVIGSRAGSGLGSLLQVQGRPT